MKNIALTLNCLLATAIIYLGSDVANASIIQCDDESCFIEQAADCNKNTSFLTPGIAGAQVRYSIMGVYKGRCDIRMTYTQHPDPEWVDLSMGFAINPKGDIDKQIKSAVAGCLVGDDAEWWQCEGPLFDKVTDAGDETTEVFAEPVAATSPPCGVEVVDDGPPLYPMPIMGEEGYLKWGYLNRDGGWAIEPRWFKAEPFSEGRAVVNKDGRWGVINREGSYVLGPVLVDSTAYAPIAPFSEGCARVEQQLNGVGHAFFVSRNGEYWLNDALPEALTGMRDLGAFSGGRAWFKTSNEKLESSFGWIDAQGKVVLNNEFTGAGEFVNGKAPAASGDKYSWAYIDTNGNPVLPDRWKFKDAKPFSEGLGAAQIDTFRWFYFTLEGAIAIDHIKLKVSREWNREMLTEVEIGEAGNFHDGLAPTQPRWISHDEPLIYIRPDGTEAFAPSSELGVVVCTVWNLPEFRDGLVQLLVADKGEKCNGFGEANELIKAGKARYVYLDSSGNIVLRQKENK